MQKAKRSADLEDSMDFGEVEDKQSRNAAFGAGGSLSRIFGRGTEGSSGHLDAANSKRGRKHDYSMSNSSEFDLAEKALENNSSRRGRRKNDGQKESVFDRITRSMSPGKFRGNRKARQRALRTREAEDTKDLFGF